MKLALLCLDWAMLAIELLVPDHHIDRLEYNPDVIEYYDQPSTGVVLQAKNMPKVTVWTIGLLVQNS
jgi:hypothetical protein